MKLAELTQKAKDIRTALEEGTLMRDVLTQREQELMEYQYQQLFEGKSSSGEDMRPYYSEDIQPSGYFRDKFAAERYIEWKLTGIPYPFRADRNPDAPNLFITGKFHEELGVQFLPDAILFTGVTPYADTIVRKYGVGNFGLTAENWGEICNERGAYNEVLQNIINIFNG